MRDARRVDARRGGFDEARDLHRLVRDVVADEGHRVRPVARQQRQLRGERRVLEGRAAQDADGLLLNLVLAADDRHDRGLAGAVGADEHAARADGQVHAHVRELQLVHDLLVGLVLHARVLNGEATVSVRVWDFLVSSRVLAVAEVFCATSYENHRFFTSIAFAPAALVSVTSIAVAIFSSSHGKKGSRASTQPLLPLCRRRRSVRSLLPG